MSQDDGQHLTGHIEEQRIDAEHLEEGAPALLSLQVDDHHQDTLQQGCQSASHHDIARAPYPLVERQAIRQQVTADHQDSPHEEELQHFLLHRGSLFHEHPAIETDEHMSHRRDGAQQSLGIDGTLVVEMFGAEQADIDPCQDVGRVLRIAIACQEDDAIDHQENDDGRQHPFMVDHQGKHGDDAIAERDALQHRPDAQVVEAQHVATDGMVQPVDAQTDEKQEHRALDHLSHHRRRGLELAFRQGEIGGHTHDEQEEREHEVAGGHAIPFHMLEHLEGLTITVVDQDHACHGDTSEDIKGEKALFVW